MSPRPRFGKLDAEKQERILRAAAEEFGAKGFEGASFNQIIERADISKGAAYYYFDDKEDLYATALEYGLERFAKWFADFQLSDLEADTFWEQLRDYGVNSVSQFRRYPWMTKLFKTFWAYAESHAASPAVRAMWQAARGWTRQFLERGRELGVVRDDVPEDLLIEVVLGIGTATDRWMLSRVDEMDEDDIVEATDLYLDVFKRVVDPPEED